MLTTVLPSTGERMTSHYRILVADDNEIILAAVQGLLESLGHSVHGVTNGREAVELGTRNEFDCVFLDIQMPEMDGFEAARWLSRQSVDRRSPWIIGFSGESPEPGMCESAGMNDFLLKPIRFHDLIRALKACPVS